MSLDSSWAKLERAITHIDRLRAETTAPDNPNVHVLPVVCEYEPNRQGIVCRVGALDHWPLVVGDTIHNLRGALDHAWWQCVITNNNGRTPSEKQARSIFFPIMKPGRQWKTRTDILWVGPKIEAVVRREQPPHGWNYNTFHALGALARLSNLDKHRQILLVPRDCTGFPRLSPDVFVDCTPRPELEFLIGAANPDKITGSDPPEEGDEVMAVYVDVTGPNPHVNLKPYVACEISLEGKWDPIQSLERMQRVVTKLLGDIERVL